jgi:hypothetical protein
MEIMTKLKYFAGARLIIRTRDAELKPLGSKFNQKVSIVDTIPQCLIEMLDKGSVPALVNSTKSDTQEGELVRVSDYDLTTNCLIVQRGQASNANGSNCATGNTKSLSGDLFLHFAVVDFYQMQESLLKLDAYVQTRTQPAGVTTPGLVTVPYSNPNENDTRVVPAFGKAHIDIYKTLLGVNTAAHLTETLTEAETTRLSNLLYFMDKVIVDRIKIDKLLTLL